MDYKLAVNLIVQKRKTALNDADIAFNLALENYPELLQVEKELRQLILNEIISDKTDNAKKAELEKKKDSLLKKIGLSKKVLSPPPSCLKCLDTGFFNGAYCECVKRLALGQKNNISLPLHDFKDSDFSLYKDLYKELAKKIFSDLEKITTRYPDNKTRNIVITGPSGTGKTYLAGCVAKAMLERGYSVTAVTAFDFVNRALSYHTTFDDKKLSFLAPLIDSALLIIDDLGTESILKNITLEYLFLVINERTKNGLLTFINSNLNNEALLARYGERIYSRLFDKTLSYNIELKNDDIRLK